MVSKRKERRPTWELVDLLPHQGSWSVKDYLALDTARYVEFLDGFLELPPSPDEIHCEVHNFVRTVVRDCLARRNRGVYMWSPFKVRLDERTFRTPDICVLLNENDPRRGRQYWSGADIIFEVVSAEGEVRDYLDKRAEYLTARVPEYWLIDPKLTEVRVLRLRPDGYDESAPLRPGEVALSAFLEGFRLDVAACFDVMKNVSPNDEPTVGGED